jgi:hypothetical protein
VLFGSAGVAFGISGALCGATGQISRVAFLAFGIISEALGLGFKV